MKSDSIRPTRRHPAVAFALSAIQAVPHLRTIGQFTERIGLSPRRFIEALSAEVGLTPKLFCRSPPLPADPRDDRAAEDIDWTDVALACGHYDQAHFIHDFRAFSGLDPTRFVSPSMITMPARRITRCIGKSSDEGS